MSKTIGRPVVRPSFLLKRVKASIEAGRYSKKAILSDIKRAYTLAVKLERTK